MSNRLQQIRDTAPRVVMSLATPGYWRPAGNYNDPTEGVVIAKADFAWMVSAIESATATASRVADLEVAIQRVLEADVVDVDAPVEPEPLNHAIRNLRAVWARA